MRGIKHCNIVDDPADALVYSTNILLNCTGGVGAALLERYGPTFQVELHEILKSRGSRFADQGEVIDHVPAGLPYKHLLHTTPCDGMYDTTPEITEDVLSRSLAICAKDLKVKRVVVSALATGFGHLKYDDFLSIAARTFNHGRFDSLVDIVLCIDDAFTFECAQEMVQEKSLTLKIEGQSAGFTDFKAPWEIYPQIPWGSIHWRMGSGEGAMNEWWPKMRALTHQQRLVYRQMHPGPPRWTEWMDSAIDRLQKE